MSLPAVYIYIHSLGNIPSRLTSTMVQHLVIFESVTLQGQSVIFLRLYMKIVEDTRP